MLLETGMTPGDSSGDRKNLWKRILRGDSQSSSGIAHLNRNAGLRGSADVDHEGQALATTLADETDAVAVRVLHIHLAIAPGLIRGPEIDRNALRDEFRMQCIHVVDDQVDDAARHSITGEGRDVQPPSVARQAHVARVRAGLAEAIGELAAEAQPGAIELFGRSRAANVEDRDRSLEQRPCLLEDEVGTVVVPASDPCPPRS